MAHASLQLPPVWMLGLCRPDGEHVWMRNQCIRNPCRPRNAVTGTEHGCAKMHRIYLNNNLWVIGVADPADYSHFTYFASYLRHSGIQALRHSGTHHAVRPTQHSGTPNLSY